MENKKDFNLIAGQMIAFVDFIKWTSSFGSDVVTQMETPLSGVRLSASISSLFGLARDDIGWMLVVHSKEGKWLPNLPIDKVFLDFTDGIVILTEPVEIFDESFKPMGIDLFIPQLSLREELRANKLLGFGLVDDDQHVERVNRVVPLFTKERYNAERTFPESGKSLFS